MHIYREFTGGQRLLIDGRNLNGKGGSTKESIYCVIQDFNQNRLVP